VVSGVAGSPAEALEVVRWAVPDVVMLDLRLGEEDGLEVAQACRAMLPAVKILVVSAHGSSQQLRSALAAGADGYLLKGVTAPELVDGLRRIARGETVIDPSFVPTLLEGMHGAGVDELLTLREMELLALVADGLTAQAAARKLAISVRTVQKHLENMHRKLGVTSRVELVQQAFRRGLLR
jgi:DNA-binding NarL/FixJ family response regulator